jgi:hypothetical protein
MRKQLSLKLDKTGNSSKFDIPFTIVSAKSMKSFTD